MFKFKRNKKGFSLIEVLVAISIIAVVIVPLAMNLISGARMNNKAKKVSTSTDISTSIIETMQTVNLSDIMIELNSSYKGDGAQTNEKDEYHGDVSKALLQALQDKGFDVSDVNMFETKYQSDGTYIQINDKSQSSVMERVLSNNSVKNYFVGQADDKYSFVLKNIKNGEMNVDVVAKIEGIHSYDLVNITSMSHSDVFFVKQPVDNGKSTMDYNVAENFYADHQLYGKITGKAASELKDKDWFLNNMKRSIVVDIVKDKSSDAVTISVEAEYTMADDSVLQKSDQKIVKELGSFTTNSTAEFSKGIHVYFNPLNNRVNSNQRDTLIVYNKQEVQVPVFFIALDQDDSVGFNKLTYRPTLKVVESNNAGTAKTVICTNLIDRQEDAHNKLNIPGGQKQITVKTIGNSTTQQVLYSISLQVYNHTESSHTEGGSGEVSFKPREKDLLSEVDGTFVDTSEKINVNNESTGNGEYAFINGFRTVYTGSTITGVEYRYVDIELGSQTTGIDAGVYTVVATPSIGRTWSDGTTDTKTIKWEITRAPTSEVTLIGDQGNLVYNAREQCGFAFVSDDLKNSDGTLNSNCFTGTYKATNAGTYTATFTPDKNHCWADDGTITARTYTWIINKKPLTVSWPTGDNKDIWVYDGTTHEIQPTVTGIISGDVCSYTVRNNFIKDVGEKYAEVASLSNSNYTIEKDREHKIQVVRNKGATYELKLNAAGEPILTYNGQIQDIVLKSSGVRFLGDRTAKNANTYTLIAEPLNGYAWAGTEDDYSQKIITWTIDPKEVSFTWGDDNWTYAKQLYGYYESSSTNRPYTYQIQYDGMPHQIPCKINGIVGNDVITPILENHIATIEGVYSARVVSLSNSNYKIPSNRQCLIEITPAPVASVINYAPATEQPDGRKPFTYAEIEVSPGVFEKQTHTGVAGQYVDIGGRPSAADVKIDEANEVVGCHKAYVMPSQNYSWGPTEWENKPVVVLIDNKEVTLQGGLPVGSKYTIVVEWMILPIEDAWYEAFICTYNGKAQKGVDYEFATLTRSDSDRYGDTKTQANKASEDYIALLKPKPNHAWSSKYRSHAYDVSTKDVRWKIVNFQMNKPTLIGDYPIYNGDYQYPNVLIFSNYEGHEESAIEFALYQGTKNGTLLAEHQSTLPKKAVNAGTYTLKISIKQEFKNSFSWIDDDGKPTTEDIYIEWKILPREIKGYITNDKNEWVYNAKQRTGTATFSSGIYNVLSKSTDTCTLTYENNKHTDAGTYYFGITDVGNSNYTAKYNSTGKQIYDPDSGDYKTHLKMVIKQAPLYIQWSGAKTQQDSGSVSAEFTGEQGSDTLTPIMGGTTSSSTPGEYKATVTGISGTKKANYYIHGDATTSYTFVVWKDAYDYDDLTNFTYNGSSRTTSVTGDSTVTLSGDKTKTNAGTYTVTLTPKAYHYWGSYGVGGTKEDTWTINKLTNPSWQSVTTSADVDFYNDSGQVNYESSTGYYSPYSQSFTTVMGKLPKITVSDSGATYTYTVTYTPHSHKSAAGRVAAEIVLNGSASASDTPFKHGGTYEVKVEKSGTNNVSKSSKTYTITLNKVALDKTKMSSYVPKLDNGKMRVYDDQHKINGSEALYADTRRAINYGDDSKVHVLKEPSRYASNYYFQVGSGTKYYYCDPVGVGTTTIKWWFCGNQDLKPTNGSLSVTVNSDDTSITGFENYACFSIPTVTNIGRNTSDSSVVEMRVRPLTNKLGSKIALTTSSSKPESTYFSDAPSNQYSMRTTGHSFSSAQTIYAYCDSKFMISWRDDFQDELLDGSTKYALISVPKYFQRVSKFTVPDDGLVS